MKEFRSHNRLDPAGFEYMWGLSRSLTDEQIEGRDRFCAQCAELGEKLSRPQGFDPLKRRAFEMTDTEDRLMASAAIMGDSSQPVNGYKTPAASGTPSAL